MDREHRRVAADDGPVDRAFHRKNWKIELYILFEKRYALFVRLIRREKMIVVRYWRDGEQFLKSAVYPDAKREDLEREVLLYNLVANPGASATISFLPNSEK